VNGYDFGTILHKLTALSPRDFEKLVAHVFREIGYNAKVTAQSHDGGIDVDARRPMVGGTERLAIQCKRKQQVGIATARELLGVVQSDHGISRGYLIVSGRLSSTCRDFIKEHGNLSSIEGLQLAKLVAEHEIALPP